MDNLEKMIRTIEPTYKYDDGSRASSRKMAYALMAISEYANGNKEIADEYIDTAITKMSMYDDGDTAFEQWCTGPNAEAAFTNYMSVLGEAEMVSAATGKTNPKLRELVLQMFNDEYADKELRYLIDRHEPSTVVTEQLAIAKYLVDKYDLKFENNEWK